MPARTTTASKIDEFMEMASEALSQTRYFETIRLATKAMQMAREADDFERMSRIALPLLEARRQRLQLAFDAGMKGFWDEPVTEDLTIEPGCWIVRPPMVGADARRLRLAALNMEVPVAVLCIEPVTDVGLVPIVAVTSGLTLRTKVRPPKNIDNPDLAWFVDALRTLGDHAVDLLDPEMDPIKKVDALLLRIDTHPDHEELHQELADTCKAAHQKISA